MKKLTLALSLLLITSVAYAEYEEPKQTCPDGYKLTQDPTNRSKTYKKNTHGHCYQDIDTDTDTNTQHSGNESGVGADIVMWQNENTASIVEEVTTEYRYDVDNKNHKVYGVVRVNLWKKVKSLFNK